MAQASRENLFFVPSVGQYDCGQHPDHILHILCTAGSMSFMFHNVKYNVLRGDYIILPNPSLASSFSESDDFEAVIMGLSETFVASMALQSNYGIVGHLSLMQNPVMRLAEN